jgi:DNA mismatch endonuclease (patch repair protein)
MSAVRSRGNRTTEVALGRMLWAAGLRGYRKHWQVEGHPDFAWPGLKIAVFVDGCFWHGCPRCNESPKTNAAFWSAKIATNRRRDQRVNTRLRGDGWIVLRVWECRMGATAVRRIAAAVDRRRRHGSQRRGECG